MPTARQLANNKKQLRREAERDRRARDRAQLKKLRQHIRNSRQMRIAQRREISLLCKRGRVAARERSKAIRAEYRARAAAEIDAERSAARQSCSARQTKARERGKHSVSRAVAALEHERAHQRHMTRFAKPATLSKGKVAKAHKRAIDAIQESDSEVVNNIPHELLPVWRAVKSKIRGNPRRSRTETFIEWVQENEPTVQNIMHKQFERDVAELIEHEQELRERVGSPKHYARMSDRELADVPF